METYKDVELNRLNQRFETIINSLEMLRDEYIKLVDKSEEDIKLGK